MFRLTREVRFAVDPLGTASPTPRSGDGHNGYAGKPPVTSIGQCFYTLRVSLAGEPNERSGYLTNIKLVDDQVRKVAIPLVREVVHAGCQGQHRGGGGLVAAIFQQLRHCWPGLTLDAVTLCLSPFTHLTARRSEAPMVRLSHTFEFAAAHRLHNPSLSDEENARIFGKCNNPNGHGHNYQLQVTVRGAVDEHGWVMDLYEMEQIVSEHVINHFDHKHLNIELPEFSDLNPSVENIAMIIYKRLAPKFLHRGVELASVTVWETEKTWCEYGE